MSYTKEALEARGYQFDNMSMIDKMDALLELLEEPEFREKMKEEYTEFSKRRNNDEE
ncbi:hypothetical protein EGEOBHOM_00182 [Enterococcus phage vB_OCPT_Car]|uniref:Uncharacterized protein n=1 Tax=Enterococcus phage vB_OCPT_Car TaxID=2922319 RepID=A0A9E7DU07_9CAUD|nr:hypothetical protein EGEOBHOM_00182 [Enterococcus phage vB_OCPT_Car]